MLDCCSIFLFFFKQKTAYEMRISDWSSDVRSSDLDRETRVDDDAAGGMLIFVLVQFERVEIVLGRRVRDEIPGVDDAVQTRQLEIGRAAGRDRGCQYG